MPLKETPMRRQGWFAVFFSQWMLSYKSFLLISNGFMSSSWSREQEHGLRVFQTKTYRFHYLESASGFKIVVTTDLETRDMESQMWNIYSVFADMVVQNPNWGVNDVIEMEEFSNAVDQILLCSVWNKTRKIQIPTSQSSPTLPIVQDFCYTLANPEYIPTYKRISKRRQLQRWYLHSKQSQKPRRNYLQGYQQLLQ